jgi:hypothetical protein
VTVRAILAASRSKSDGDNLVGIRRNGRDVERVQMYRLVEP